MSLFEKSLVSAFILILFWLVSLAFYDTAKISREKGACDALGGVTARAQGFASGNICINRDAVISIPSER